MQVIIVGIIRHAEKAPTNILYKVDDMTAAPMDVRQWVDTDVSITQASIYMKRDSMMWQLIGMRRSMFKSILILGLIRK